MSRLTVLRLLAVLATLASAVVFFAVGFVVPGALMAFATAMHLFVLALAWRSARKGPPSAIVYVEQETHLY